MNKAALIGVLPQKLQVKLLQAIQHADDLVLLGKDCSPKSYRKTHYIPCTYMKILEQYVCMCNYFGEYYLKW